MQGAPSRVASSCGDRKGKREQQIGSRHLPCPIYCACQKVVPSSDSVCNAGANLVQHWPKSDVGTSFSNYRAGPICSFKLVNYVKTYKLLPPEWATSCSSPPPSPQLAYHPSTESPCITAHPSTGLFCKVRTTNSYLNLLLTLRGRTDCAAATAQYNRLYAKRASERVRGGKISVFFPVKLRP